MAASGLNTPRCVSHAGFVGTFFNDYEASMALFVMSNFMIPVLVVLLITVSDIGKDKEEVPRRMLTGPSNQDAVCTSDAKAASTLWSYHPRRGQTSPVDTTTVARLVGSTILLGLTACLVIFQILLMLFVGYCVDGMVHKSDLLFLCTVAGVGAILVAFGLVAWLMGVVSFIQNTVRWCWYIKRWDRVGMSGLQKKKT